MSSYSSQRFFSDEVSALSLMPMKEFPRLGALIFGEGVLNDAISIVLFHVLMSNHARDESNSAASLQDLALTLILEVTNEVFLSFAIGVSCGLANARLLKSLTYLREHPIHQTVLLLLFAYLAYTIAESVGVSGILTLFVTAVTQGHYSWHSLSKPAQVATKINAVALSGDNHHHHHYCYHHYHHFYFHHGCHQHRNYRHHHSIIVIVIVIIIVNVVSTIGRWI